MVTFSVVSSGIFSSGTQAIVFPNSDIVPQVASRAVLALLKTRVRSLLNFGGTSVPSASDIATLILLIFAFWSLSRKKLLLRGRSFPYDMGGGRVLSSYRLILLIYCVFATRGFGLNSIFNQSDLRGIYHFYYRWQSLVN